SLYRPLAALRSLKAAIEKHGPDLIVCCDERALAVALDLYKREKARNPAIAGLIARSLGAPDNYPCMLSRLDGLAAMREMGVRVPAMMAVESKADVDKAIAAFGFPLVLKADQSWGGSGVAIARTREEAVAKWRKLSRPASRLRSLVRTLRRRDAHFLLE